MSVSDMACIEAWHHLFRLQGPQGVNVRMVFDQSVQRFVDAINLHRARVEERRLEAHVQHWRLTDCQDTEDQVRHIMMARLPLYGFDLKGMQDIYALLHDGRRLRGTTMTTNCMAACQLLKLEPWVTNAMLSRVFVVDDDAQRT